MKQQPLQTTAGAKRSSTRVRYLLMSIGGLDVQLRESVAGGPCVWFALHLGNKELVYEIPVRFDRGGSEAVQKRAENVAWFRVLRYVEAVVRLTEADVAPAYELFLPYLVVGGQTVADRFTGQAALRAAGATA